MSFGDEIDRGKETTYRGKRDLLQGQKRPTYTALGDDGDQRKSEMRPYGCLYTCSVAICLQRTYSIESTFYGCVYACSVAIRLTSRLIVV